VAPLSPVVFLELVDDRPGGIGAESIAPGKVEPIRGLHQGEGAVADSFGQVVAGPVELLGERDDKPQVALDDPVLQLQGLVLQSFNLVEVDRDRGIRIDAVANPTGEALRCVVPGSPNERASGLRSLSVPVFSLSVLTWCRKRTDADHFIVGVRSSNGRCSLGSVERPGHGPTASRTGS
jgi:hypothetical protein